MLQRKKLALFISHIYGEYQKNLIQGLVKRADECGYRTEIFASNDGEDLGDYAKGEECILSIPSLDDFDGIIFAPGTYYNLSLRDKLSGMLADHKGCQIIEIAETPGNFPTVAMENNRTAGSLTEHMITVHGSKSICYLGLFEENYYSNKRRESYESVMAHHHLPVSDRDVFTLDHDLDYAKALSHFTEDGKRKIDAIICYNDDVALGLWSAAYEKGYEIPKDFGITGCDQSSAGQSMTPTLTTVSFPSYQVGVAAVDLLIAHQHGQADATTTIFAEPVYGGSCGCNCSNTTPAFVYNSLLNQRIQTLENSIFTSMKMSADFSHITDVDDGMDLIASYVDFIDGCNEFYLCLYSDWDSIHSHVLAMADLLDTEEDAAEDSVLLKLALKDGRRLPECSFSRDALLPTFVTDKSEASYVVCPLFFENRVFGYLALAFKDNRMNFPFKLNHWLMNITQMLQNLCRSKKTAALSKHLEDVYLKDVLTGLLNHHGFLQRQEFLFKKCNKKDYLIALMMDLDLLKTINDSFGHAEGDFALKTIGQAIQQALGPDDIAARFSGDEFYVLLRAKSPEKGSEFIAQVDQYLDHFNKLSSKPFNVCISAGYEAVAFDPGMAPEAMDAVYDRADEHMYEYKKNKVKNVLR